MTILLAPRDYERALRWEFPGLKEIGPRLFQSPKKIDESIWAANIWHDPIRIEFDSVREAARKLRAIQRNWCLYSFTLHRRAKLIQSELPHVSAKPLHFPCELPTAPLGSWTLLDQNTILASPRCSSPLPNGEYNFAENKHDFPTRAYLKLWEFFTRVGFSPGRGESCVDLGASPGGWSIVLASLGCKVTAIDGAPLNRIASQNAHITFQRGNMFSESLWNRGKLNWIFSDAACEPGKLLNLIRPIAKSNPNVSLCCTIKLRGSTSYSIIRDFLRIPGSKAVHLHHNKHEVTWYRLP